MKKDKKLTKRSMSPTTTIQQDLTTAGQRKVNLIWEYTQALIAVTVVVTTMAKAFLLGNGEAIPTIFSVAFGTIVGFYFARTNHQAIGGTGDKPEQEYKGR